MKVGMVLRPGQKGTLKLQKEFGETLFCVRYRYDDETKRRIKTVELVVDESKWEPRREAEAPKEEAVHSVDVRIPQSRTDLVSVLERRSADYDEGTQRWRVPYTEAMRMGLRRYIVSGRRTSSRSLLFNS